MADLMTLLIGRIADIGPMPFDDFMRVALYDPDGGYYTAGELHSMREGDFLTSPEVSPMFGEALAVFVAGETERLGLDKPVVIEVGAGSGSLLRPMLDRLEGASEVWAVEVSSSAREEIARAVPEATVVGSLSDVGAGRSGVVVANELLDNQPVAVAVRTGDGWDERLVDVVEEDTLVLSTAPARPEIAAWADKHRPGAAVGEVVEVQVEAYEWMGRALGLLDSGSLVVFDYGDSGEGLSERRPEGTVRTYHAHHLGPDPLVNPGSADITSDVDFSAMDKAARAAGAETETFSQAEFLAEMGLRDRVAELRRKELDMAFTGDPMERLKARSKVSEGATLLHPRGLGDFKVLVARK